MVFLLNNSLLTQAVPAGMVKLAEGVLPNQVKRQMEQNFARLKKEQESAA